MRRSIRRAPLPTSPACSPESGQSARAHDLRQIDRGAAEVFERLTRRYGQPEWRHRRDHSSAASACRCTSTRSGSGRSAGCCISSASSRRAPRRPQPKLLIVAPMSGHYATLLRGTVEAFLPNHDVYITDWVDAPLGAVGGRPLRSRRLHRLRHLDAAHARRRRACDRGVPAVGAGAGGGRADGSRRRSLRAALHDADGRADRHPHQSDRGQQAGRVSAASTGSATTSSPRCRSRIPASCATSIRASCSCTAS